MQAGQALETLANSVTLSPYEAGIYESTGDRRFEKIVRFATVDCVKAGWLIKHKGVWSLTDTGTEAYQKHTDPASFYKEAVRLYNQWKAAQAGQSPEHAVPEDSATAVEDKTVSVTYEQAEEQAWGEIEQYLRGVNPYEFQELVADLLRAMGYHIGWISPAGKDGGVDIIANTDPLGTRPPRIKVQVKRISHRVDTDGLKSFIAIINEDDVGLFISTGGFTREAQSFARNQERRRITLIDLERLIDLWIQFYGKLDDKARQRLPLTPIYFLTPPN
ncbi:Restriction endonuclease [Cupriavidus taiwanensis]|uniref:Restriction endonuclease n=2 Tax=Cupriavidus taiwanensis TaxID=164546 RepID=A0A7Z7NKL9_9BURK|nr:Restriction endonuclease [Cupriavidus taiwanensis]SOZ02779.1 Restriction endonuclease [Cupriavidus taiwanensis]SPC06146.1 Restriction endonuclease [Cupriavidus taiwanensis]SPD38177.1 Restriction endonuclease [Cupriavidus taiwanensis]